jgi:hypothetical protein
MRRMPNATFVNSRKRARESVVSWSDGSNAVHTYGPLSLPKGEGEGEDLFPQLATARLQPKSTTMDCTDQQELEGPA